MPEKLPDFNSSQWKFISIMDALGEPVSVDVIGSLRRPLPPGEFLDLLRKCDTLNWVHRSDDDLFSLTDDIPENVKTKLKKINSAKRITGPDRIPRTKRHGRSGVARCVGEMPAKNGEIQKSVAA